MSVVLEEDRDRLTEIAQFECADVMPIDEDLAVLRIVQPHDELEDRALPSAVRTYDHLQSAQVSYVTKISAAEHARKADRAAG